MFEPTETPFPFRTIGLVVEPIVIIPFDPNPVPMFKAPVREAVVAIFMAILGAFVSREVDTNPEATTGSKKVLLPVQLLLLARRFCPIPIVLVLYE